MRTRRLVSPVPASLLALAFAVGCAADEPALDGEHDTFVGDGKSDTGGIAEGTAEAAAVLQIANTFTRAELVSDVGLAARAADNLLAVRAGDDELADTGDDEMFTTLAELDAVPFIGPIAFGKLLAFAQANDLVEDVPPASVDDPFDPASCQGPQMTMQAATARWQSNKVLGTYQLHLRKRTCSTETGGTCEGWQSVPLTAISWAPNASGVLELGNWDGEIRLKLQAGICSGAGYNYATKYIIGSVCDGIGEGLHCSAYDMPRNCYSYENDWEPLRFLWDGHLIVMSGKLTENCVQLIHKRSFDWSYQPKKTEYEAAILERF